ncbi:MAG: hypothetical protein Q4A39_00775, partial [Eubacteriales bacterium]|nr:hypothetical protein [Eubacteriales bacterium]
YYTTSGTQKGSRSGGKVFRLFRQTGRLSPDINKVSLHFCITAAGILILSPLHRHHKMILREARERA